MTPAELFMLFLPATVVLLALGRSSWRPRFYYWPLLAAFAFLTVLTGYFAWRNHESIRQLKVLIELPPFDKSVYVPRRAEIRTIARLIPANVPPNFPMSRQEMEQVKKEVASAEDLGTFWILESKISLDAIRDFYEKENHRRGWEITEQSRIHFLLKRENSTLEIFFIDDFPRPNTAIVYIFDGSSGVH